MNPTLMGNSEGNAPLSLVTIGICSCQEKDQSYHRNTVASAMPPGTFEHLKT